MKLYRLVFLVSSKLELKKAKEVMLEIQNLIKEGQGEIKETKEILKTVLAYEIKKENSAYLGNIQFNYLSEKILDLEEALKGNSSVLRFLIVAVPKKKKIKAKKTRPLIKKTPAINIGTKEEKIKLDEINQKIDQILKN